MNLGWSINLKGPALVNLHESQQKHNYERWGGHTDMSDEEDAPGTCGNRNGFGRPYIPFSLYNHQYSIQYVQSIRRGIRNCCGMTPHERAHFRGMHGHSRSCTSEKKELGCSITAGVLFERRTGDHAIPSWSSIWTPPRIPRDREKLISKRKCSGPIPIKSQSGFPTNFEWSANIDAPGVRRF